MKRVQGRLIWARVLPSRPSYIPVGRPRGAKAEGLRYEKRLASWMPDAVHGPWFEYCDSQGIHVCQPDLMLDWQAKHNFVVLIEVKYGWVPEAQEKLDALYKPVVLKALGVEVVSVVACRRLEPTIPRNVTICQSLDEAIDKAKDGSAVLWHWLGSGRVKRGPRLRPLRVRTCDLTTEEIGL
jgi:hypothetical protein